ncbi:MAG: DMT family transporter [Hyphomonadaceae bacterium]
METAAAIASERAKPRLTGAPLSWAALMLLVVIWGSTFAGIRVGVETITPGWLVAGRLGCGTLFLGVWILGSRLLRPRARADNAPKLSWRAMGWFALIGIGATMIPFVFYAHAAESVGSAVMAICNGATPFATVLLAHMFTGDKLTPQRIAGVLLGFCGLVLLVLPEFGQGMGASLIGILLAIVGAWLYAVGNVGTRLAPRIDPVVSSFLIVGLGAAAALLHALVMEPFPVAASAASITAMIVLGLLPTAFAMFVYVWLIQRAGPVFVSFTTYMSPLWATGLGVMFLGEQLHWSMIGALALILLGVAVANARVRRS